eukprot:TRINITY_DN5229_c0_g1_i14.p1 TRINITY_DN5229_c0_g1~~TRINITY_DN5229_c0_g1_i14.p1  ORF type:complete len:100 (+),score=7.31 TRINITY_DN5229_c0_g1_i14:40-300(+)
MPGNKLFGLFLQDCGACLWQSGQCAPKGSARFAHDWCEVLHHEVVGQISEHQCNYRVISCVAKALCRFKCVTTCAFVCVCVFCVCV